MIFTVNQFLENRVLGNVVINLGTPKGRRAKICIIRNLKIERAKNKRRDKF